MTPERIAVEVSAAVAATKARMASEDRVYPAPLAFTPGDPEALAELARFDRPSIQRRLARLFADDPTFRLPTEDGQ